MKKRPEWMGKDKPEEVVTDVEMEAAFAGTNFGTTYSHREILDNTVLKCASGWSTGHTAKCISIELGLTTESWKLTRKGKYYLWVVYSQGKSL